MENINERLEDLVAKMKEIGDRPAPKMGGSIKNLIDYQAVRGRILELCLDAINEGYRFKAEGVPNSWVRLPDDPNAPPWRLPFTYGCRKCKGLSADPFHHCPHCGVDNSGEIIDWSKKRMPLTEKWWEE